MTPLHLYLYSYLLSAAVHIALQRRVRVALLTSFMSTLTDAEILLTRCRLGLLPL